MEILINDRKIKINWYSVLYFLITVFYFFYVTRDLEFNTAFVDEAIYATVGEEALRGSFWEDAISWMGGSYFYPLLSATINRYLGLKGVRLFSVLCVLVTGIIAGRIGRIIGGRKVEIISLFLFFFSATTLDLSQHATYDAPSLVLTALSAYTAIRARGMKQIDELVYVMASGIFLSFAILAKYVAILFVPGIFLVIFLNKNRLNFLAAFCFATIIASAMFIYLSYYLNGVITYFSGSYSQEPSGFLQISERIVGSLPLLTAGLVLALVYLFWPVKVSLQNESPVKMERKRIAKFLIFAGAIPILYHLGSANARSLWKHLVFASFFWTPVTAWLFNKLYLYVYKSRAKEGILANMSQLMFTIFVLLIITSLWVSFSSHWRFQRSWPSATNAINYLRENRKPDDKIFAEGSAIYKYHLFTGFEDPYAWSSTWYLEFEGKTGPEAMKAAIQKKEFDYIVLNGYFTGSLNQELMGDIYNTYSLALVDVYKVSGAYDNITTVWKPKN